MHILKCENNGFCFGVDRAIKTVEQLNGDNNYVLGEIIHNEKVIDKLKSMGIKTINSLDEVNFHGGETLIIRTHGESKATIEKAKALKLNIIDCTCPFVKQIQEIVNKHYLLGYKIVIIGNASHPEIIGINGWCEQEATIINSRSELEQICTDKMCIVVQTTYSEEKFNKIIKNFDSSKVAVAKFSNRRSHNRNQGIVLSSIVDKGKQIYHQSNFKRASVR